MNLSQILQMALRIVMKRAVSSGVNKGIDAASRLGRGTRAAKTGGKGAGKGPKGAAEAPLTPEQARRRAERRRQRQARRAGRDTMK